MGEIVEMDGKGRIVIPSHIRNKFGLEKGSHLEIVVKDDEIVLRCAKIVVEPIVETKKGELKDFLSDG